MAKTLEMKPHAVMISIPAQGHLSPFVSLALKLASKGFKVTFVNTEHAHHQIAQSIVNTDASGNNTSDIDIFTEARNSGLDIQYRTISDGFPLEYDRVGNANEFWESLLKDFPIAVDEFIGKIIYESSLNISDNDDNSLLFPILVADTFAGWAAKIAEKYELVNVSFWTEPALVFATTYYMDLLIENEHFSPKDDDNKHYNIDYIPGVESIRKKDLPSYFNEAPSETPTIVEKIVFSSFNEVKKADFILHNTVQELEPRVLKSLEQTQPTYAIGPINFTKESEKSLVPRSLFSETDCSKWLDTKPSRSVLYISFGSVVPAAKHVIEEISRGLALSEVSFLWITRSHNSINSEAAIFPAPFLEEVDKLDKGFFAPWCDQRAVLSHPAIGGFLTHCGWNSVLESMWSGVPMICYPVAFDQPTNRKLVIDDWKIGIDLHDEKEMINAEDVAEKIKKVMSGGDNEIRNENEKVSKIVHNALDDDGSSERNFNRFVDDLKVKIRAKTGVLRVSD